MNQEQHQAYDLKNRSLIKKFLIIWLVISLGCSILLVEILNLIRFGNVPLGFWLAQQGSILVFVVLNFAYAHQMDKLDYRYKDEYSDDKTSEERNTEASNYT